MSYMSDYATLLHEVMREDVYDALADNGLEPVGDDERERVGYVAEQLVETLLDWGWVPPDPNVLAAERIRARLGILRTGHDN